MQFFQLLAYTGTTCSIVYMQANDSYIQLVVCILLTESQVNNVHTAIKIIHRLVTDY